MDLPGVEKQTDHELHGQAVLLAGKRDQAAKLLHKAPDRLHRQTLSRFRRTTSLEDSRELWRDAVRRAQIPGAVLTHPLLTSFAVALRRVAERRRAESPHDLQAYG
jgi:hypothetical protein